MSITVEKLNVSAPAHPVCMGRLVKLLKPTFRECGNSFITTITRLMRLYVVMAWPPYVIGQAIIFLSCGFFFLLSSSFFPRLISAVGDWMSTILPHMVYLSANLGCRSETYCTRLAENTERKNSPKFTICGPSYNFVGLYLHN